VLALGVVVLSAAAEPEGWRSVHIGTVVMGALLVHEYLEAHLSASLTVLVFARESRLSHRLSWFDPLSSPPVQAMLHTWFASVGAGSPLLVLYGVALASLLVPVSPGLLVVPLGASALIGLVLSVASLVGLRRSVRRIVQHAKDETLKSLRERIERLEPRERELTADESERLRALLDTYAAVRDAPTGPPGVQTLGRAVTALAIPALTLFLAVMSEVYAERLLDQLLP
jgi:membrane protein implicated in regulation of membrane protease activity